MQLIIDGYNLLNAVGILPRGIGPGSLERSRAALLNFLAESLPHQERQNTTVVFDAGKDAPRGLPREQDFRGITIHFASQYDEADTLIEELIRADTAPRSLTVVSSDHRLQRAARRRRARAVDSDRWYAEVLTRRRRERAPRTDSRKPQPPTSAEDIAYWLDKFTPEGGATDQDTPPPIDNPFPPGYADDLLDEDSDS